MSEPIISVSGLRGIVGESLTPLVVARYVAAFARAIPPGPIVVGYDGRTTGRMLLDLVVASLRACSRHVIDVNLAATPTVGVLVRTCGAIGGVQVSASHNPPEYNGLKLFNAEGRVIPADAGQRVLNAYREGQATWAAFSAIGDVTPLDRSKATDHLDLVCKQVDIDAIRARRFRVLLDSNAGAGSVLGRQLLATLGCQATLVGEEPDGRFLHPPEPTAANLIHVGQQVMASQSVIGFCQDPDADRLAIIDEKGRYLGEEYTLAICVDHILRRTPGPVVTNCATSRMTADLAANYGVPCHQSAVGEANVVDLMKATNAIFGGEGNGGPIHPQVGFVRDSFVGIALTLDAMAARSLPVSKLAAELPRYEIHKTTLSLERERWSAAFAAVETHFADAQASRLDGLRLDWPDRWLILRGSNTEPIARVIAEAPTAEAALQLCETVRGIVAQLA